MIKYPIYDVKSFNCNANNSELYVNTFFDHLSNHSFVEEPHRHNSYLLVFFTRGSGSHHIDFERFLIQPGSLFLLQPGQIHNWNLSEDIEGFVIIYSGEIYDLHFRQKKIDFYPFYNSVSNNPQIILKSKEKAGILPYFELMISESLLPQRSSDKIINLLDCIHIELAKIYSDPKIHSAHNYNTKIKSFEKLLETNFRNKKSPSFYASRLNITLKHLNRICNEILKKTATEVITKRIILEAKRMLSDKNLSVNEIADALGYEDYSYFSRLFRKHTNQSPTEFRKLK